jgi:Winged helix DNA-binding domain
VTRERVLAFRLARHHLGGERAPDAATAAFPGLQDTPPGSAGAALAARADAGPEALDELVTVPSLRGAATAVALEDLAIFTTGLEPSDEDEAKHLIGNAWKDLDEHSALEALDTASEAVRDVLADGPLIKSAFHRALTARVPKDLRWWCKGCGERHVHPSLWRATGIRCVLAVVGRDGRSPVYGAPPPAPRVDDPGGALARRYLQAHGPTTPLLFRYWASLTLPHAKRLFARAGELAQVGDKWVLAEDAALEAPAPGGARLLPNLDPLASAKDREILVPDEAVRKRIWISLGGPGMALVDGEVAGLWRPRKKGKRLVVELEPLRTLTRAERDALAEEAERLAPFRGAETGEIAVV